MTKKEAAVIEVFTGMCMLTGDDRKYVYQYADRIMGRPVQMLEFATMAEKLKELAKPDFIEICRNLKSGHQQDYRLQRTDQAHQVRRVRDGCKLCFRALQPGGAVGTL